MFLRTTLAIGIALAAFSQSARPARSAPVEPGQFVIWYQYHPEEFFVIVVPGTPIAQDSRAVTFNFGPGPDGSAAYSLAGTFREAVFRDDQTRRLTFTYEVVVQGGFEDDAIAAGDFDGYSTDLVSSMGGNAASVSRSGNGKFVSARALDGRPGPPIVLAVTTNAIGFDRRGTLFASAGNTYQDADISLTGTFQPTGAPTAAIPLPSGALAGLLGLALAILPVMKKSGRL